MTTVKRVGEIMMLIWWLTLGTVIIALLAVNVGASMNGYSLSYQFNVTELCKFIGVYLVAYVLMRIDDFSMVDKA